MTPKDKAKKLAMKFDKYGETDNAKKSALIAVDEIIKSKELNYGTLLAYNPKIILNGTN